MKNDAETQWADAIASKDLLGGLTLGTVLNLKWSEGDSMSVTHAGPDNSGKYAGFITTLEGRPIVSSKPAFASGASAEEHMRKVIKAAREFRTMHNPPNADIRRVSPDSAQRKP
jgi:hypothetical protein